jgi:23S rRNA (pseudouridine1915-N3)-methyltransferase
MKIHLIATGSKMPLWVKTAYEEYTKRLPKECQLNLVEISSRKSAQEMLKKIPPKSYIIALTERGESWDTIMLSHHIKHWQMSGKDIVLLIGGADGLAENILEKADKQWSLSRLTFPHMLVRIIVAEQLYRAYSLLSGHPYHRA